MRIAFLYSANDPYINTRIKYLLGKGHEVFYFGFESDGRQESPEGATRISIKPGFLRNVRFLRRFANVLTVRALTGKHRIDILHINNMGFAVHAIFSRSRKTVLENEGSDVLVLPKRKPSLKRLYKFLYRFADAVVQDSLVSQEAGIDCGAPIRENHVLGIGVDFSLFNLAVPKDIARERLALKESQPLVFSSRGLVEVYNTDILIKTIPLVRKCFPDVVYVLCALQGNLNDECKALMERENAWENLRFAGVLNHETEIAYYYRDADVVVSVPSSDSSPASVYEAMACGTPVIASELPWYHEKFRNGKELVAVPVRDVEALASAIIGVLNGSVKLDTQSAYEIVFEKMNQATENRKLEELYEHLLGKNKTVSC